MKIARTIVELIGCTPMLHLGRVSPCGKGQVYAKLESFNPGGSIKDRASLGIILDAESRKVLKPGWTVVEATAGNTGIGLAMVCRRRDYNVILFMPEHFAEEKCILMEALGATVIRTPKQDGMIGAMSRASEYARVTPKTFYSSQFDNSANADWHQKTTAVELLDQMDGKIDVFIAGVGSSGTFTGIARHLKSVSSSVTCIAVETEGSVLQGGEAGPHRVEGIGVAFVPAVFDRTICDRIIRVTDRDAFGMVRTLASLEGVLSGSSGGAAVFASVLIAGELGPEARIATVIADSAERYLSQNIFQDEASLLGSYPRSATISGSPRQ